VERTEYQTKKQIGSIGPFGRATGARQRVAVPGTRR
jgi:hypothetical protein